MAVYEYISQLPPWALTLGALGLLIIFLALAWLVLARAYRRLTSRLPLK